MRARILTATLLARLTLLVPDAAALVVLLGAALALVPQVVLLGKLPDHFDFWLQEYVHLVVAHRWLRLGEIPLWNGQLAAGTPQLADPQAAVLYPFLSLPALVLAPALVERISIPAHFFLAGAGTYAYARALRMSRPAATGAGLAYALAPHFAPLDVATYLQQSAAWVPMIVWALHSGLQTGRLSCFALAGTFWALQLLRGYAQTWYITGLFAGAYCLVTIVRVAAARSGPRHLARLVIGSAAFALVAVTLGAAQLLPSLDLLAQSQRGSGFSLAEASGPGRISLANLLGVAGPDAEVSGAFPGGVTLALALVAVAAGRGGHVLAFGLTALTSLMLALGDHTPLWSILYRFVPGFQTVHMPHRVLFLWSLSLAVLAGTGIDTLARRPRLRGIAVALGLALGVTWISAATLLGVESDVLVALIHLALGAACVIGVGTASTLAGGRRYRVRPAGVDGGAASPRDTPTSARRWPAAVAWLLVAAAGIDALSYSLPRLHGAFYPPDAVYAPTAAVQWLQARARADVLLNGSPYRFASARYLPDPPGLPRWKLQDNRRGIFLPPNVSAVYPGLDAAQGYLAIHLLDSGSLFDAVNDLGRAPRNLSVYDPRTRLLDLLGVRYFLADAVDTFPSIVGGGFSLTAADQPKGVEVRDPRLAASVEVVSSLGDSVDVEDGTVVGEAIISTVAGREMRRPLRAGVDTAEWLYDDPRISGQIKHRRAQVARSERHDGFQAHAYRATLDLTDLGQDAVRTIRFDVVAPRVRLNIERVTLNVPFASRFRPAYADDTVRIWENPAALPRAWWVPAYEVVTDRSAVVERLREMDYHALALVDRPVPGMLRYIDASGRTDSPASPGDGTATARQVVATANTRGYAVTAPAAGLLVVGESFASGWRARIDGMEAPVIRADGFLQGVAVPAGTHRVDLEYRPRSVIVGAVVSASALVVLVAWSALCCFMRRPGVRPARDGGAGSAAVWPTPRKANRARSRAAADVAGINRAPTALGDERPARMSYG